VKPECCTSNRARLCRNHLAKCPNFKEYKTPEEMERILALPITDDRNKYKKLSEDNDSMCNIIL
jgi:hypothetical protein